MDIENVIDNYKKYVDVDNNGILNAVDAAIILEKALDDGFKMPIEK